MQTNNLEQKISIIWIFLAFLFSFSFQKISLAAEIHSVKMENKFDSTIVEIENICFQQGTKAKLMVSDLYKMASENFQNTTLLTKCLYIETAVNHILGKNDSTLIPRIQKILVVAENQQNYEEEKLLRYTLALGHSISGDYAKSFTLGLEVLEDFKKTKDSVFIAKTLNLLGNVCRSIKSYNMSEEYYLQAIKYTKPGKRDYYAIRINLFSVWRYFPNRVQESIDSLLHLATGFEKNGHTDFYAIACLNLAGCYLLNQEFDKAFEYFKTILEMEENIDNDRFSNILYQNLAGYFFFKEDYAEALGYLHKAIQMAIQDADLEQYALLQYNLSNVYEKLGNVDSAYFYLTEYNALSNRLFNNSKAIEAYKEYISVYLESSKNKLTIAEQELALKNRRFWMLIISSVAAILSILLLLTLVQQKKKQKEKENKELEERLEQEKKIQQLQEEKNKLQEEKHEEIIESKLREITSYSLQLSNKSQLLQQIADLAKVVSSDQKEFLEIKRLIKSNLNSERDWNDFLMHFNKVHPKFFEKLKMINNSLTENNLRMCAYFRIGMPPKQIAQILNITPESISMHRYRLKKKLGLDENENLDDFIRNI